MNEPGQELLERIAGTLGHELRNPLASAVASASLVRELLDAGDPRIELVDGVLKDLDRTARLLSSYLACARTALRAESIALASVCAAVARRHTGIVSVAVPAGLAVRGDALLLERALENLIDNARRAGAGAVTLRAGACAPGRIELVVEDDGRGVPAALRERIFDVGFTAGGGTGLGLPIVRQTLRAHGGSVRCEAGAQGARFVLELPAEAPAEAARLVTA